MTVPSTERSSRPFMAHHRAALPEIAFQHISKEIIRGNLVPGDRVRSRGLAIDLDMSMVPVREAVVRLRDIGLVEVSPSQYTRVSDFATDEARAAISYAGILAGAALRSSLPRMSSGMRSDLALVVDRIAGADTGAVHIAAVVEFLDSVTYFIEHPRHATYLIETTLLVQCVLQFGRPTPRDYIEEEQSVAAMTAARALRAGGPATAEVAIRELFDRLG